MDLQVSPDGFARWGDRRLRCALGRTGVSSAKREGDGATPAGLWLMRAAWFRPDRESPPATGLPLNPTTPQDGWCDASGDPAYNRRVRLPSVARAETLWREDGLYDLLIVLGYNDDPIVPAAGSAIFLHLAGPDFGPTKGCVAVGRPDLRAILAAADRASRVVIG